MPKKLYSDEEWLRLITECRQSGLTDKEWCDIHGIYTATFYRIVKRLRKKACDIPEHPCHHTFQSKQEVVQVAGEDMDRDLLSPVSPGTAVARPEDLYSGPNIVSHPSVKIMTETGISIEIDNNADPIVISAVIRALQTS